MIAYNLLWLKNLVICDQAEAACQQNSLDKEEYEAINNHYAPGFYSPHFFIRLGLFLLSTVIVLFTFGLFALMMADSIDKIIGGLAIFFGLLSYGALEFMVQSKRHFRSGVDDALLWIAAACLFGGISYLYGAGDLGNAVLIFLLALVGCLRFADRVMCVTGYLALLAIFFFSFANLGMGARAFIPFIIMAVSATTYFLSQKSSHAETIRPYSGCINVLSVSALLSFYFAGNYYVVRELSNELFNLNLAENEAIPLNWLFWIFTTAVPFIYILRGILKKDVVLLRVGLLLIAMLVFTLRYYYAFAAVEVVMVTCGVLLIAISFALTRYLRTMRHGFTNLDLFKTPANQHIQIESLLQAQTLGGPSPVVAERTQFGGGSFGGGGATGEF